MKRISIPSIDAIAEAAHSFLQEIGKEPRVIAFVAPMGTGKTTFIKALSRELGTTDITNSPTFAIVNEYETFSGEAPILHMDCYRLNQLEEALELGFEDYFSQSAWCLVEWPEVVKPILPQDTLWVNINLLDNGERELLF